MLRRFRIPIEKVYSEIDRSEREPFGTKKIDWRHSLIPVAFWLFAYLFVFVDTKIDGRPTLISVAISVILLVILLLLIFAKSLERDWTESILAKLIAESLHGRKDCPIFEKRDWQNTVYSTDYIFTSERWKYNLYRLTKYFCYGLSYPIVFAISVSGITLWILSDLLPF